MFGFRLQITVGPTAAGCAGTCVGAAVRSGKADGDTDNASVVVVACVAAEAIEIIETDDSARLNGSSVVVAGAGEAFVAAVFCVTVAVVADAFGA